MKKIYIITFILSVVVTIMSVIACGDDNNSTTITEGKKYQQDVVLPAKNADIILIITDLNTAIKDIEYYADWLTVIKQTYISGSPTILLKATDNVKDGASTDARSCKVTITAGNEDCVFLSVKQEGVEISYGIDDSHDIPTDQPAHSRG